MNNKYTIRRYKATDESQLFSMLEREGEEWSGYWQGAGRSQYRKALESSLVYLLFEGDTLCGYARCRDDDGFGLYVYDLLVDKACRGKEYGRFLMEQAAREYSGDEVYVMGDVYPYYEKLGYSQEGKIYIVKGK